MYTIPYKNATVHVTGTFNPEPIDKYHGKVHECWMENGQFHNPNGPAVIWADGTKIWYQNGQFHNPDGPAVVKADGYKAWYLNGKRHNPNGPAIIRPDGTQLWYEMDRLHNQSGPAVIRPDGTEEWWFNGEQFDETDNQTNLNTIIQNIEAQLDLLRNLH